MVKRNDHFNSFFQLFLSENIQVKRKVVEAEGGGRGKGRWCSGKRGTPSCLSLIGGLPKKSVLLTNFSLLKHSPGAAPGIDR